MKRFTILEKGDSPSFWNSECQEKQITSVYVRHRDKNRAEVHWDYQEGEVCKVLFENEQHLDGYITGLLDTLDIPQKNRICHSGLTGTITALSHDKAEELASLIADKLVPLCEARKKRIKRYNNLPHVKYQREKQRKAGELNE